MEGSSGMHFARALYRAGMLSRRQLAKDAYSNVRFRLEGSTDAATDAVRKRVAEDLAGVPVKRLLRLRPEVLTGILPRVYPDMLEVAYAHQDADRPAYIVTAASQDLAELLAVVLTFDGGIGARYEVKDGVYTGRPGGPFTYREGKVVAMLEVAEREGIDLAESYAYSDSESDLPMLRAVGHPVAVNPDSKLLAVARQEGWEVMRFDKLGRRLKIAGYGAAIGVTGFAASQAWERFGPGSRRR
ncbi:MAG: HAD-IB family hydrolase [Thermoleophilaceae bacterium]|nr:HAD-IB family hydrolase [Thermoleophilaceae bacterium]